MNIDFVILALIGINIFVSYKGFNDANFFSKYMFHVGKIQRGENLRMVTSGFLHADIAHLAFNMLTLYFFAPIITRHFGDAYFLLIYFIGLLGGNFLSLKQHAQNPNHSAIGASGAVTAIVYGSIAVFPKMSLYFFFIPIPIPAYLFAIGYMLYSLYGMKKQIGNIGHTAHIGGAIAGLLATILLDFNLAITNMIYIVLILIPIVLYFFTFNKK